MVLAIVDEVDSLFDSMAIYRQFNRPALQPVLILHVDFVR